MSEERMEAAGGHSWRVAGFCTSGRGSSGGPAGLPHLQTGPTEQRSYASTVWMWARLSRVGSELTVPGSMQTSLEGHLAGLSQARFFSDGDHVTAKIPSSLVSPAASWVVRQGRKWPCPAPQRHSASICRAPPVCQTLPRVPAGWQVRVGGLGVSRESFSEGVSDSQVDSMGWA